MSVPNWLKHGWRVAVDSVVGTIAVAAMGAVFIAFFVYRVVGPLTPYSVPLAVIAGLFALSSVATAAGAFRYLDDRAKEQRMSRMSDEKLEELVWAYLRKYKFTIKNRPSPDCSFQVDATDDNGETVAISKGKSNPWLTIHSQKGVIPTAVLDSQFRNLLARDLLQLDVGFAIEPGKDKNTVEIPLTHLAYIDGSMLSDLRLTDAIRRVTRAVLMVKLTAEYALTAKKMVAVRTQQAAPLDPKRPQDGSPPPSDGQK